MITNATRETLQVKELRARPGSASQTSGCSGSPGRGRVFSLSHVAVPFPPDDPLYGYEFRGDHHVQLGRIAVRGENGVLGCRTGC